MRARLPYLAGLDGLRAIAVVAVLLYHAELSWVAGGFLGVEVFFVISGYLITALLLAEWRETGGIDLKRFWIRRARRLLPALFALLAVVTVVAVVFLPGEVAGLRGDVASALAYVTNWSFILGERSYFEAAGRPSMVQHLWSLAVEEQFYLLWPLLFAGGMRLLGRRRFPVAILGVALASFTLMWVLYEPGGDPSRVYYGTDTRAAGIFLGALLAFVWAPWRLRGVGTGAARVLDVVGVLALAVLVRTLLTTDEFSDGLYRGGFLGLDLVTLVVIAVAVHPAARLGRWLGVAPLRWLGLRSYSIYLWHWPVYVLTRPGLDVPVRGLPLLALRLAITLALAEASYRWVEQPVRQGGLGRLRERVARHWGEGDADTRLRWSGAALAGLVVLGVLTAAVVRAERGIPPAELAAAQALGSHPDPAPPPAPPPAGQADPSAAPVGSAPTEPPPATVPVVRPVVAVGDSVMLGAEEQLHALAPRPLLVDAAISRQVAAGIEVLAAYRDAGELGDTVVVHLGNNGVFRDEQFDELMAVLAGRRVLVLTVRTPDRWQDPNNEVIAAGAARHPGVVVVDWHASSAAEDGLFYDDGMHMRPSGADRYAALIAGAL